MSMNGIDISSWQNGINLAAVPCEFVIVKATEGTTYMNPYCDQTLTQAEELGKKRGVYHYASGLNANEEAEYFVNNIRGYIRKAILVLDWEVTAVEDQTGWVKRWLDRVYQLTGVKPFIYMSNYVVNDHDWGVVADAGYRLWNAYYYAYGTRMGYNPDAPLPGEMGAWKEPVLYQYTSEGQLEGYQGNLDLDVFYGSAGDWERYALGEDRQEDENPPKPPQPQQMIKYRIRYGDTLGGIARRYGTTVTTLAQLNGIPNPNRIYPGQIIRIPVRSSGVNPAEYYVVQPGDTLSGIAVRFGTTYQKLAQLNGIRNPNRIYVGQRLRVR
ncbi:MAG: LysM peptidoglycan-binding domain-containing protein [Dorea sp.]|nr:LysM peptidoglycan-binding domain-containing protein [Dorea sp.]